MKNCCIGVRAGEWAQTKPRPLNPSPCPLRAKPGALIVLTLLLALAPLIGAAAAPPDDRPGEFEERRRAVAALMEASTVWIVVENDDSISVGSGFIVADKTIVTNAHVVEGAGMSGRVYVLNEKLPACAAKIAGAVQEDKEEAISGRDFALLHFDPPEGVALSAVSFNFDVKRMDRVSAWGYPAMVTQFDASTEKLREGDTSRLEPAPLVYTEGTVNAVVRDKRGSAIIHSAALAGGNSGGPLVNGRGEVVGMNTWGYREDDEGAFVNAAQPAAAIADFLAANGVSPRLAPGQSFEPRSVRQDAGAQGNREGTLPAEAPQKGNPGKKNIGRNARDAGEADRERTRDAGSFSVRVPRGWSVLEEESDSILLGADDQSSEVGISVADGEGMSLAATARELSKNFGGARPVRGDDGDYSFTFTKDGVERQAYVLDVGDGRIAFILISGDAENAQVREILNSIEDN
jgi:S1-C subfamily serine protease